MTEKLANERIDTVRSHGDIRRTRQGENTKLFAQIRFNCRLKLMNSAGQIVEQEELAGINTASREHVVAVDVCEPARTDFHPGVRQDVALDAQIFCVVF